MNIQTNLSHTNLFVPNNNRFESYEMLFSPHKHLHYCVILPVLGCMLIDFLGLMKVNRGGYATAVPRTAKNMEITIGRT